MELFTIIYRKPVVIDGVPMFTTAPMRVWANNEDEAHDKCESEFGNVYLIIKGHPEILWYSSDEIETYNWGN